MKTTTERMLEELPDLVAVRVAEAVEKAVTEAMAVRLEEVLVLRFPPPPSRGSQIHSVSERRYAGDGC